LEFVEIFGDIYISVVCNWGTGYLSLSMVTALPPGTAAYKTPIMWMKVVFQTPSSNSCIKSTTNVGYGLNPNDPSFSVNTFLRNDE
jgi:hypothetical protein